MVDTWCGSGIGLGSSSVMTQPFSSILKIVTFLGDNGKHVKWIFRPKSPSSMGYDSESSLS